jgi:tRNA pseudouridine38-40 synthase
VTRFLLTLQYLGTRYAGWQTQSNAVGVQQVIEAALTRMCNAPVKIEGAGRTDSGVHARAQTAHADIPVAIDARGLRLGANNLLPPDIRVIDAEPVADDFHCRFRAKEKTYVYQVWNAEVADVFLAETHAHVATPLDHAAMRAAAQPLRGQHDFAAFTVASPEVSSTLRTVLHIDVQRDGNVIRMTISADGFLRYMVRRIAGSLIEVGRGRIAADALARSLEPEFAAAKWTAPAKGLILESVKY